MSKKSQVKENYAAFVERLPSLITHHSGKFALMNNTEIVDFFDTARDAFLAGKRLYGVGYFSVQGVIETPVDLGFFSHAMPKQ